MVKQKITKIESKVSKETLFIPVEISDLLKIRLLENRNLSNEKRLKLDSDYKLQLTAINIAEAVREDELIKNFMENSGFNYSDKYSKEDDLSFIHVFKKEKSDSN